MLAVPVASVIAVDAVAAPSILSTEAEAESICSFAPLLTVPLRSSVPPEAVSVLAFEIGMLTVPEPVMLVVAEIVPVPLIVPPLSVIPLASVNWVPLPARFIVLLPTANALVAVRVAPLARASVPAPLEFRKLTVVAVLLAPSSSSLSVPPPSICNVLTVEADFASNVPPEALIVPLPERVAEEVTLIVP